MLTRKSSFQIFLGALLLAGCSTAPRVIPIPPPAETLSQPPVRFSDDYPQLLTAISTVMVRELNFPRVEGTVTFFSNYQTYEAGLAAEFTAAAQRADERSGKRQAESDRSDRIAFSARQRAVTTAGIAIDGKVLVHEISLRRYSWSEQVRVLAHELTHVLQRDLAGRGPARWENWLVEGFADWVAYKVLDSLKIESFAKSREEVIKSIAAGSHRELPGLAQLSSQADIMTWTRTLGRYAAYGQGLIAADYLIEQKGLPALLEYFRSFAKTNSREKNFAAAFGESPAEFSVRFRAHLKNLLAQ